MSSLTIKGMSSSVFTRVGDSRLATRIPRGFDMVPIMLAVARWCSGNHKAASLAGEKMTRVWARAQKLCPPRRKTNGSWMPRAMQGMERITLPQKFRNAPRVVALQSPTESRTQMATTPDGMDTTR